jgi:hypothetical protein
MKDLELYRKYKTKYSAAEEQAPYKRSVGLIIAMSVAATLLGPLLLFKYSKGVAFSTPYYIQHVAYFSLVTLPFAAFLVWSYRREAIKQSSGYHWVGKFEVLDKQSSFTSLYLVLSGTNNKVKVERSLFEKTRIGDFIIILRDALGNVEEIKRVNRFSHQLKNVRSYKRKKMQPVSH